MIRNREQWPITHCSCFWSESKPALTTTQMQLKDLPICNRTGVYISLTSQISTLTQPMRPLRQKVFEPHVPRTPVLSLLPPFSRTLLQLCLLSVQPSFPRHVGRGYKIVMTSTDVRITFITLCEGVCLYLQLLILYQRKAKCWQDLGTVISVTHHWPYKYLFFHTCFCMWRRDSPRCLEAI